MNLNYEEEIEINATSAQSDKFVLRVILTGIIGSIDFVAKNTGKINISPTAQNLLKAFLEWGNQQLVKFREKINSIPDKFFENQFGNAAVLDGVINALDLIIDNVPNLSIGPLKRALAKAVLKGIRKKLVEARNNINI